MKNIIVSNDFYVSEFLMNGLDSNNFDVIFEHELKLSDTCKTIARLKAFLPSLPGSNENVVVFAIENILVLDEIYKKMGKPKIWLWNPISSMKAKNRNLFLSYIRKKKIQVWSFDQHDVEKYGFRFHNQIHSSSLISNERKDNSTAFFSGVDKGRLEAVKKIKGDLSENSIKSDFHIVRDKKKNYHADDIAITTDQYIDFTEYLEKIVNCKIIVDVGQYDQKGITLRVIEALFSNKKLITTNFVVSEMDFYHPANIYLYGSDERSLTEFINEPSVGIANEIKEKYTFQHLIDAMLMLD